MPAERLQKIISAAGVTSRRKAEQLITGGMVSVHLPAAVAGTGGEHHDSLDDDR